MTNEQSGATEHAAPEQNRNALLAGGAPALDFDWKELFLGQRRPGTLFDGFRERVEKEKLKQRVRDQKSVSIAPLEAAIAEEICDSVAKQAKQQIRLTDVLRSREISDVLKAETVRIAEMALLQYADPALLRAEPIEHGAEDIWKWIGQGKRRALSRSDWQKVLAVLFLRRLKSILTAKQVNEFLWRALFAETRISQEHVLIELDKDAVYPVDDRLCSELVSRMVGGAGRTEERLVAILQRCGGSKTVVTEQILVVAEQFLKGNGMPLSPSPSAQDSFSSRIEEWLHRRKKNHLAQKEMQTFFAALLVGRRKDALPEEEAARLLHAVLADSGKKKGQKQGATANLSPAVLAVPPGKGSAAAFDVFLGMLAKLQALEGELVKARSHLDGMCKQNEQLQGVVVDKAVEIDGLKGKVTALESDRKALQEKVAGLEQDLLRFQDGLTHRIDQLRSKVRSVLEGPATRHLQNALEAIHATPPWIEAAEERIEDAMKVLRKEAECLRPSQ